MRSCVTSTDIDIDLAIPSQNSANDITVRDVIGGKTDDDLGDSIYSKTYIIDKHLHTACGVWPSLAAGVSVPSTTTPWELGALTIIANTNDITGGFYDIHFYNLEDVSAVGAYQIQFYQGLSDVLIGASKFSKTAVMDATKNHYFQTPFIPSGSRISARLASDNAVADTAIVSIEYHLY